MTLNTPWQWEPFDRAGVRVYVTRIGREVYRVCPEDPRSGAIPWRADYYDCGLAVAASPEAFDSPEAAAEYLFWYHAKRSAR